MRRTVNYNGDRNRSVLVRLLVAILLIGAGLGIGRWTAPNATQPSDAGNGAQVPASTGGVGPRAIEDGVPVGYERSEQGALQAAINYARALGPGPGEGKKDYAAKLRAIASAEWGDELESTIDSWDEGEAEVAPVRFSITEFSNERAEVALWFASYVNPRNGSPGAVWGRAFINLVWEEDDWKVAGEDGDAGPWPVSLSEPSTPSDFSSLLTGFEVIEYEPASLP